jgi:hypothetical protein
MFKVAAEVTAAAAVRVGRRGDLSAERDREGGDVGDLAATTARAGRGRNDDDDDGDGGGDGSGGRGDDGDGGGDEFDLSPKWRPVKAAPARVWL